MCQQYRGRNARGTLEPQHRVRLRDDELVRVLFGVDGLVPLYNHQIDIYALMQRITQKTGYGLINPRALVLSTGKDVRYNA